MYKLNSVRSVTDLILCIKKKLGWIQSVDCKHCEMESSISNLMLVENVLTEFSRIISMCISQSNVKCKRKHMRFCWVQLISFNQFIWLVCIVMFVDLIKHLTWKIYQCLVLTVTKLSPNNISQYESDKTWCGNNMWNWSLKNSKKEL